MSANFEFGPSLFERNFKFYNNMVANTLSLILNGLLIIIVFKNTMDSMKPFKKVLLSTSMADSFLALTTMIIQDTLFVDDSEKVYFQVLIGPLPQLNSHWVAILGGLWCFGIYFVVAAVPPTYIYRTLLICKGYVLNVWQFALVFAFWAGFAGIYGLIWGWIFFANIDNIDQYAHKFYDAKWQYPDGSIPAFVAVPLTHLKTASKFDAAFFPSVYITVIVCSVLVHVHMSKIKADLSTRTRELRKKMTKIFVTQAMVSMISMGAPLILDDIGSYLGFAVPGIGLIVMFCVAWVPLLNPLMVFIVFSHYREALVQLFRKKKNTIQTVLVSTSPQFYSNEISLSTNVSPKTHIVYHVY